MGTLWIEKQQGRQKALSALEAGRQALALAEPASPGENSGQPLALAIAPVYFRTKATYVLWMLQRRCRRYYPLRGAARLRPESGRDKGPGKDTGPGEFETQVEHAGARSDLAWFFDDWVNADKGLPDLSIESVFPTAQQAGNWLVAVNIANSGYASAEVPVTVRTDATSITQRVRIPARGKAVQRILIQGKPTEVQVNDGTVPESQASVHVTTLDAAGSSSAQPAPDPSTPH